MLLLIHDGLLPLSKQKKDNKLLRILCLKTKSKQTNQMKCEFAIQFALHFCLLNQGLLLLFLFWRTNFCYKVHGWYAKKAVPAPTPALPAKVQFSFIFKSKSCVSSFDLQKSNLYLSFIVKLPSYST